MDNKRPLFRMVQDVYSKLMIPPSRPILLVLDGHGSHVSIDVIEYTRSNEIYLICLPSHTSHTLQPLDGGVF